MANSSRSQTPTPGKLPAPTADGSAAVDAAPAAAVQAAFAALAGGGLVGRVVAGGVGWPGGDIGVRLQFSPAR